MQVVWTATALRGLLRTYDYLSDFNPIAATQVIRALREAGESLAQFPYRGRPVAGTTMREAVTAYPYIIRYRVDGSRVLILRIRHTSRRPTTP
jgi:addiction module RelE/StbE family toxin